LGDDGIPHSSPGEKAYYVDLTAAFTWLKPTISNLEGIPMAVPKVSFGECSSLSLLAV